MEIFGLTDPGNVREQNQDYYLFADLDGKGKAVVVCDGMGGAKSGNVASKVAAEVFLSEVGRTVRYHQDPEKAERAVAAAVALANTAVYENSISDEAYHGMGTTLVAAVLLNGTGIIANVGDSRAYLINDNGIRCVTTDHSVVEMMVQRGELTREQAKSYPGKNLITRAVGTEESVACDLFRIPLQKGDNLLLCTDGLSNLMADQEILFEVAYGARKNDCCQRLVRIAKERGAPDNATAVLVVV